MAVDTLATESRFAVTPKAGEVSSLLLRPDDANCLLVLGHGASAGMGHRHMQAIAEALAEKGIATFRYNFPYMERGGGRDSRETTLLTVQAAVAEASRHADGIPIFAGGHSFGGRMTSHAAAEGLVPEVKGLVFCSFPLHRPGSPSVERAEHLDRIEVPMLFLSGTRDTMAELDLLKSPCARLPKATLHLLDTADHGWRVLKRSRSSSEDVYAEAAGALRDWIERGCCNA